LTHKCNFFSKEKKMLRTKGSRAGSRIAKVEVHQFSYEVRDLGIDTSGNRCGQKGASSRVPAFIVTIETADGARGEYCSPHAGKSGAMSGQVLSLAPQLLGEDAEEREALFDRAKRLHRQTRPSGACWAVTASGFPRMPAP
jgi:hypothetical protein